MAFIRSISGIRATLGEELLPDRLSNYIAAFESILPPGDIIIGMDGRPSGYWIEHIAAAVMMACGRNVISLGLVPTPTVQLAVEKHKAAGGISITASHNPENWNGLKFINKDGIFLDIKENTRLWKTEKFQNFRFSKLIKKTELIKDKSAVTEHIDSILNLPIFTNNSLTKIKNKKYKIVVDAVNAAGSKAIPMMLRKFGCEVIELFCDETGIFPHTPEPVTNNLKLLADEVKKQKADLGIAVDPDADRLALINENGEAIGEERTIVLAIETILRNIEKFKKDKHPPCVVVNQSTTRAVDDICAIHDVKLERSAVGEINVVKEMKKHNSIIGGEGSGGVILPACHYGRDSLVGTALVLYLMASLNKTLSQINNSLPQYNMVKNKCEFNGDLSSLYLKITEMFPNGKIEKGDGIKILFPDSWVQARASNTEPIIRIISEDPESKEAKKLVKSVMDLCPKTKIDK
jgi:phosphomannomutase